jgi:hypothetical protein
MFTWSPGCIFYTCGAAYRAPQPGKKIPRKGSIFLAAELLVFFPAKITPNQQRCDD